MSDLFKVREEMGLALAHARLPGMGGMTRVNNAMVHEWLETLDKETQKIRQMAVLLGAVMIQADQQFEGPPVPPGGALQFGVSLEQVRKAEKGHLRMWSDTDGGVTLSWSEAEPLAPPAGTS